jgi:hypothetical protein
MLNIIDFRLKSKTKKQTNFLPQNNECNNKHWHRKVGPIKLVKPCHSLLKCLYQPRKWATMYICVEGIDFALIDKYMITVIFKQSDRHCPMWNFDYKLINQFAKYFQTSKYFALRRLFPHSNDMTSWISTC